MLEREVINTSSFTENIFVLMAEWNDESTEFPIIPTHLNKLYVITDTNNNDSVLGIYETNIQITTG